MRENCTYSLSGGRWPARKRATSDPTPVNLSNKEEQSSAEMGEGRARAKENIAPSYTSPTQSGKRVSQGWRGVGQAARERKEERFTALLHHVTIHLLRDFIQRVIPISPQARFSLSWYPCRIWLTSSRRAAGFRPFLRAPPAECAYPRSGLRRASSVCGSLLVAAAVPAARSNPNRQSAASNCRKPAPKHPSRDRYRLLSYPPRLLARRV